MLLPPATLRRCRLPVVTPVCSAAYDGEWREKSAEAMEARDWASVEAAVAAAVEGEALLPGDAPAPVGFEEQAAAVAAAVGGEALLPGDAPAPVGFEEQAAPLSSSSVSQSARITWRLRVAYLGVAFSGFAWQSAAPKPTVEGCLQQAIQPLLDGRSELRLSCAGRTDAGVSSLGQLVSFHSWPQLSESDLHDAVARASPERGALRLVDARRMDDGYHATFSTAWRRYAYLLPASPGATRVEAAAEAARLDGLLRPLAGEPRDYAALGRSVPAGKDTTMTLRHAAARLVELPVAPSGGGGGDDDPGVAAPTTWATRIDLVGDRFLRRQVRTLVSTAVACASSDTAAADVTDDDDAAADAAAAAGSDLLEACTSGEQRRTAHPAPSAGLVLAAAGSADEFDGFSDGDGSAGGEGRFGDDDDDEAEYAPEYAGLGATAAAAGTAAASSAAAASTSTSTSSSVDGAALAAALALLEAQQQRGAPLDVLLLRHARAHNLQQHERSAISTHLDDVARCHARLGGRLRAAGVEPTPRSRLLASLRLCRGHAAAELPATGLTPEERRWLAALAPPLAPAGDDAAAAAAAGAAGAAGSEGGLEERAAALECPAELLPLFDETFGGRAAAARELLALQTAPPLDLRVNTLKTTRREALAALRAAGFAAEPTPHSPVGIRLRERGGGVALGRLPGLLEGRIEPQDEGSQLVALLLGALPGEHVVDYCAGTGGKTLALAAAMANKGRILATDIDAARLERAAPRHVKAGVDTVTRHAIAGGDGGAAVGAADKFLKRRKRSFDRVLVDAPCSGVGAWRRNPDARWLRRTRPLSELLPVQAEVLRRAARLVRPGGTLVYATCSLLRHENDAQLAAFLASDDGAEFELAPPSADLPADFPAHVLDDDGCMRLTPARHGCDGFFGARLTRREGGWTRRRPRK